VRLRGADGGGVVGGHVGDLVVRRLLGVHAARLQADQRT
jgi:hypothetical protein